MASCYSDAFELLDFGDQPEQRHAAASKAASAPPGPLSPNTAEERESEPADQTTEQPAREAGVAGPAASAWEPVPAAAAAAEEAAGGPAGRLLYVRSARLQELSAGLPLNRHRATLVHALTQAAGLLEQPLVDVAEARPASIEQLREYHSQEYLAALAHFAGLRPAQLAAAGLQDDCAPFPGVYEFAALVAGGSLQAAAALASGQYRTAVNFDGGRHHAHKSQAAGFCYSNDAVLAILSLLGSFKRVMYVDIDIHHCDAVQEAFDLTDRVLTISLHKYAPGFFPGTGSMGSVGEGPGRGFALNLPLQDGLRDDIFAEAFRQLAGGAVQLYRPDCVVLQCGVDGLAHDPVGASWGLTPGGYAACASEAALWGRPLLVLGGGGYDDPSAARAWAAVLAAVLARELADEVPEHDHLDSYGPNYQIFTVPKPLLAPDTNSRVAVAVKCEQLLGTLRRALEGVTVSVQGPAAAKRARAA